MVIAEDREEGILIRPAIAHPLESYAPTRRAQFLLSIAVDGENYARAEEEVRRKLGLEPAAIPHHKP